MKTPFGIALAKSRLSWISLAGIVLAGFALLLPTAAAAQDAGRTLRELQDMAVEHSEDVRLGRAALEQAELGVHIAEAARLPRLDASASYSHVSETASIDFAIPVPSIPPMHIRFGDGNVYDAGLTASVPLFTGSRLSSAVALQRAQVDARSAALDAGILDLRAQVASAWYSAMFAGRSAAILDAQLRFLDEQMATRRSLVAQGQALAYDTLVLATRGMQLRVDRAAAEEKRQRALLLLAQLAGVDEVTLRVDAEGAAERAAEGAADLEHLSTEQLLARACAQRPELRGIAASRDAGARAADLARAAFYPSVMASAAYRVGRPGVNQVANEWMGYWTAGIRAEWNLWSWGADSRAAQKADIDVRAADLRDAQLRSRLRTQIAMVQGELAVRRQTIALLDAQTALEREKLALTAARQREGLATASDLVEAETALTGALLRREQTHIEYSMKLVELRAVLGEL